MTPKEFDFMVQLIEAVAREAYLRGHGEGDAGHPPSVERFKMGKGSRLTLKTTLEKHTKSR
jgi:hypothetical protein